MSKSEIIYYSSNKIKKAGKALVKNNSDESALEILSSWRSEHIYPLEKAVDLVKSISSSIDRNAIIASRPKRIASIIRKLERYKDSMYLSTMNDIAGCRVIMTNQKKVDKLVKFLTSDNTFKLRRDYIKEPKDDGYKSVHLIGEFPNIEGKKRKVELQVRTKIQHSWATALEIVDLFTKQSIKTNMIEDKRWSDFFKYASMQFALLENNNFVNSNNINATYKNFIEDFKKNETKDLNYSIYKVYTLCNELEIISKFHLFKESLDFTSTHLKSEKNTGYILIKIDIIDNSTKQFNVSSSFYKSEEFQEASREYLENEKLTLTGKAYVTALISTESIGDIEVAYPNYFADSTKFIEYIKILHASYSKLYPSLFSLKNSIKYTFKDLLD